MIAAVLIAALTLLDVETAAVAHAPSVVEARQHVKEQEALLDAARGGGLPHVVANYAEVPQAGTNGGTIQQRLTTISGQVILGDIAARDPLIRQAAADLRNAVAAQYGAERTERVRAIGLYVAAIRTHEVLQLRESILANARADRNAAQLRFRSGDVPRLDVVRADVSVARARADVASARADETNARQNLATEIASPSASLDIPTLAQASVSSPAPPSQDAAIASALSTRPEIRSAMAEVAAEEAAVRAAKRAILPALTVQAGYTRGTDSGITVAGPSANVTLDVPVSRVGADRTNAEGARLAQAQARLEGAKRAVTTEVANAFESLRAQREAADATATARSEAAAEVQAALIGYREGASSSLDLADARRTYATAVVDDVTARAALDEAILTFALAVGDQP